MRKKIIIYLELNPGFADKIYYRLVTKILLTSQLNQQYNLYLI